MRHLAVLFLLCCGPSGCGPSEAGPTEASHPEGAAPPSAVTEGEGTSAETPEPAEPPVEGGEPTGGGGPAAEGTPTSDAPVCERARACCRAYVEAIPSARRPLEERGCTEMDAVLGEAGEAADDACEAAIGGWRQSLQLTGIEVPAPCR